MEKDKMEAKVFSEKLDDHFRTNSTISTTELLKIMEDAEKEVYHEM